MKIFLTRTSYGYHDEPAEMEVETLEECINKLIEQTGESEYVIKKPKDCCYIKEPEKYDWYVEIYDDYRE